MGSDETTPFAQQQQQEVQQPVNGVVIEVSNESDVCPQDYAGAAVGTALCGLWGYLGMKCCCPSPWGQAGAMLGCTIYMAIQAAVGFAIMGYMLQHPDTKWCSLGYSLNSDKTECCQEKDSDGSCDWLYSVANPIDAHTLSIAFGVSGGICACLFFLFFFAHSKLRKHARLSSL